MARDRKAEADAAAAAASDAGRVLREQREDVSHGTEDAPKREQEPVKITLNDDHKRAMDEIRASREAAAKGEAAEPTLAPEPTPPSPDDMLKGDQFSESPQPAPEQLQEAVPTPAAEPPKVKVKVDGEEFEVSQTEIDEYGSVKGYQLARASENRLKKASEAVAETRRMQEMLINHARQQMQPQQPQLTDEQFIASKMDVIRFGNQEEASAALIEVLNRKQQSLPDQVSITNQAVAEIKYQGAVEKFKADFPEISANPQLEEWATVIAQKNIAAMRQNQQPLVSVDWNDFFGKIGNQIRNVVGKPSQPAPAPASPTTGTPSPVSSEREARKASIVNLPTASARAELPREQKPETREQALDRMRRTRGQQTG